MTGNPDKDPKNFLVGILVGIGSVLPGISGGIIAVAFGVYERLIAAVGEIRAKWREEFWFLAILGSGIVFGMGVAAVGMRLVIDAYEILLICCFLGLIVGQLPEVWGLARDSGEPGFAGSAAAALGFAAMVALLYFEGGEGSGGLAIEGLSGAALLAFAGFVMAMAKVIPGLSGSAILIAMGLYSALIVGVTDLDPYYIAFLGVGFVVGIFAFAKAMTRVLENHRVPGTYLILGLTVGCVPVIAWQIRDGVGDLAIPAVLAFALGLAVAWAFNRYARAHDA
ncbi:MAG: DUF368 domain-containing protein [Thermoplasmatales archaeon]|nr:DUF368 domain-containing protein [Thermoplasmatales archaeon]